MGKKNITIVLSAVLFLFSANILSYAIEPDVSIDDKNINDELKKDNEDKEILIVDLKVGEKRIHYSNISINDDFVSITIDTSELKNCDNNDSISLFFNNSKLFLYSCEKCSDNQIRLSFSYEFSKGVSSPCQKIQDIINGLNGSLTNSNNESIDILSVSCSFPTAYKKYTLEIAYSEDNISKILNSSSLIFKIGNENYYLSPAGGSNNVCLYSKRFEVPNKISSEESIFLDFINDSNIAIKPLNNLCNLAFSIISKMPQDLQKKYVSLNVTDYNSKQIWSIPYDEIGISHTTSQKKQKDGIQFSDNYTVSISINKENISDIDINLSSVSIVGTDLDLISYVDDDDKLILNYYKNIPYNSCSFKLSGY